MNLGNVFGQLFGKFRKQPKEWLKEIFPIIKWFPKYKLFSDDRLYIYNTLYLNVFIPRLTNLPYDFIAGLTVALTLLPISLAYAQMASLRPEYGLYSSFLAQFIYIFMGTSKDAIIGPSAINSMLVGQFNAMNPMISEGDNTYAVILSFFSGIILFLIGILKLGFIVNLFSIPVVSGFTTAACLTIMGSQLKSFFGLKSAPNEAPGMFVRQVKNVYDNWDHVQYIDMYFGLASLAFLLVVEYSQKFVILCMKKYGEPTTSNGRYFKKIFLEALRIFIASRNIMVFIPCTGIAYYLASIDRNYEKKMSLVGFIKSGFPVPTFPRFAVYNSSANAINATEPVETIQDIFAKLSVAFVIMPLMLMMELFAILKALGRKNGYRLNPTNELVAIGLGNFLQSFIQAYPVTAATAKSALNDQCRVKSLLSTTVSIVLIIIAIETMTGIFYYVPKTVLAAILIAAAHHLFDYETVIHLYREYKPDLLMFIVTFLMCLFYDLAYGILISILLNMITFLRPVVRMEFCVSKEPLFENIDGTTEYVTVIQLSHGMKYPSVDKFIDRMTRILYSSDHHFVVDCRFVTGIDFSGLQAWRIFLHMVYQKKKHVIFANLLDSVRVQLESVGLEHFCYVEDIESAIKEHSAIKSGTSVLDAKALDISSRLHHMISIVSTSEHRRSVSIDGGGVKSVSSIVVERIPHVSSHHENFTDENDRKEQEARLMKVLSFQPHFFDDIPYLSPDQQNPDDAEDDQRTYPTASRGYAMMVHGSNKDHAMNASFSVGDSGVEKASLPPQMGTAIGNKPPPPIARRRKTLQGAYGLEFDDLSRSHSHDFPYENSLKMVSAETQTTNDDR